jgi:hypothetical protein
VYPMTGGIEAWLESGLPTDDADLP